MSSQSPESKTAVANRVADFVIEHKQTAERWAFEDHTHNMAFEYALFTSSSPDNTEAAFADFPPLGGYEALLRMGPSYAGYKIPQVNKYPFIKIALMYGELHIADGWNVLPELLEDVSYINHPEAFAYAANTVLDKISDLEATGVFMPAGQRKPPLV